MPFLTSLLEAFAGDESPIRPRRSDLFADVSVTNQFGKEFRFKSDLIKDRAVVINTMFTICRGSCPGTSATLQRLRKPLSKLFGKRVTILSITIDPENDTVALMRDYADIYDAAKPASKDQCDWYFITSTPANIETLRRSLGFYDLDPKIDSDISRHASLLFFGNDTTDRWATSPVQIRDGLIFEPLRRILGTTVQERFGLQPQKTQQNA
ncbi:MAG: SCO family protein [Planctomycetota bacterium]|nr:SCO family protein [Planctomycetota bacterium]